MFNETDNPQNNPKYMHSIKVSSHVGRLVTEFSVIVGRRCSHVNEHKQPTNHIMVAYYDVEGCGHGPLDFYATTKALQFTYQRWSLKDWRRRSILGHMEEEVLRWAQIWEDESS